MHTPYPTGTLLRALVGDRAVRLLAVEAHAPADHTRALHGLGPDAARLGAEALVAAALSGAHTKGQEQLTLQIQGASPRCAVYVDATAAGDLRARVTPPELRLGPGGTLAGILMVTKHAPGGEVYRGATSIDGTTLEAAIAAHLGTSQQVDAIDRLGARIAADGTVAVAHGLLLERLPDEPGAPSMSAEAFTERFGWVRTADLGELMVNVALGQLGDEPLEVLERTRVGWRCRCSRAKIAQTLGALAGGDGLREMIEEDHGATVTCHFCTAAYRFDEDELRQIAAGTASA